MKYRLKKDTPEQKAGAIFAFERGLYRCGEYGYYSKDVENNPEWFDLIEELIEMIISDESKYKIWLSHGGMCDLITRTPLTGSEINKLINQPKNKWSDKDMIDFVGAVDKRYTSYQDLLKCHLEEFKKKR